MIPDKVKAEYGNKKNSSAQKYITMKLKTNNCYPKVLSVLFGVIPVKAVKDMTQVWLDLLIKS